MRSVNRAQELTEPTNETAGMGIVPAVVKRRVLRVWMVADNAPFRAAFAVLLNGQPWLRVSQQFASVEGVLASLAEERPPDVIIVDLGSGKERALSAIRPIRKNAPAVKVLMLTTFNDTYSEGEAFRLGASGFLLKIYEIEEIITLIYQAYYNPADTRLFPNLTSYAQPREPVDRRTASAGPSGKRPHFLVALRQLWRLRRRERLPT
jgi:DNA-binding NarL/FixJ family response regulator